MSNESADTAEYLTRLGERLAALERHVFEQDKEMLALSRQLEQLRGALLGLRERLSEPSGDRCSSAVGEQCTSAGNIGGGDASQAFDAERPPHY